MYKAGIILFLIHIMLFGKAQTNSNLQKIEDFYSKNEHRLLKDFFSFLSIPNTSNDKEQLVNNANFILQSMTAMGIQSRLLYNKEKSNIPVVYGEVLKKEATKTIIFYAHYDGQPVNPANWATGLEPFTPQLLSERLDKGGSFVDFPSQQEEFNKAWRIYGRASSDDKAGVFIILSAYEAIKASGLDPNINIKFFFEGEEEAGSTNLEGILQENLNLLHSDLWIICDGPMPASGKKQITYGVRGDVNMYLTVYGPKRPLHSGNYGNWAPNPAHKLARLLATMKDDHGKVLIKDYYKDVVPLSKSEKAALSKIEDLGPFMQQELGFANVETKGRTYLECIATLPTLNINGMSSANTGRLSSNIIPATASATLDLRMVKGNTVASQIRRVKAHIEKIGYYIVDREPSDEERKKHSNLIFISVSSGYPAQRTPMDLPIAQEIVKAVASSTNQDVVLMPSAGGSLPLYLFEKVCKTYPITIPLVNFDNNQHAENENLVLGKILEGMKTMASVMLYKY